MIEDTEELAQAQEALGHAQADRADAAITAALDSAPSRRFRANPPDTF